MHEIVRRQVMDDFKSHLETLILSEHSRVCTEEAAAMVGGDADRFAIAWDIFCNGAPPLPQRIAWVLDLVTEAHPSLAARYVGSIAARLPYMHHPAEARAATKILARSPLPQESLGDLLILLFEWLEDPQVPIAIRCNAMQVLYNITEKEPDLKRELLLVIQGQMAEGGPGVLSRGKRLSARLQADIRKLEMAASLDEAE